MIETHRLDNIRESFRQDPERTLMNVRERRYRSNVEASIMKERQQMTRDRRVLEMVLGRYIKAYGLAPVPRIFEDRLIWIMEAGPMNMSERCVLFSVDLKAYSVVIHDDSAVKIK